MKMSQGGSSMPRAAWGLAVLLVVSGLVTPVSAQPMPLSPVGGSPTLSTTLPPEPVPEPVPSRSLPPEPSRSTTPVTNLPPVLGAPVRPSDRVPQTPGTIQPVSGDRSDLLGSAEPNLSVTPIPNYEPTPRGTRGAVLGVPTEGSSLPSPVADPGVSPQTVDPNDFLRMRSLQRDQPSSSGQQPSSSGPSPSPSGPLTERSSDKFGGEFEEKLHDLLGKRNEWFKSDHAFDGFISPVTNPFLFEDPRSLTEVRPIFIFDKIPSAEPDFRGGNTIFFGTQLRIAVTDRLSFTINKLGGESLNPGSGSEFPGDTGFAELWLGPKYTFIRNENTGSVLAGGLQFQIPVGGKENYQDTGSLSLVPYVSYAQSFLRDLSVGSFNGMASAGYSFSVNNERSDYFYLSAHIDMNVLNANHFFPLVEMNWFTYTTNGKSLPIGVEGQDLINFGGQARGQGLLTGAIGGRYKFTENYQLGAAFEIPIAGPKDLFDYRFTLDFIFRY
jgi:hypothetical protein